MLNAGLWWTSFCVGYIIKFLASLIIDLRHDCIIDTLIILWLSLCQWGTQNDMGTFERYHTQNVHGMYLPRNYTFDIYCTSISFSRVQPGMYLNESNLCQFSFIRQCIIQGIYWFILCFVRTRGCFKNNIRSTEFNRIYCQQNHIYPPVVIKCFWRIV